MNLVNSFTKSTMVHHKYVTLLCLLSITKELILFNIHCAWTLPNQNSQPQL